MEHHRRRVVVISTRGPPQSRHPVRPRGRRVGMPTAPPSDGGWPPSSQQHPSSGLPFSSACSPSWPDCCSLRTEVPRRCGARARCSSRCCCSSGTCTATGRPGGWVDSVQPLVHLPVLAVPLLALPLVLPSTAAPARPVADPLAAEHPDADDRSAVRRAVRPGPLLQRWYSWGDGPRRTTLLPVRCEQRWQLRRPARLSLPRRTPREPDRSARALLDGIRRLRRPDRRMCGRCPARRRWCGPIGVGSRHVGADGAGRAQAERAHLGGLRLPPLPASCWR